MATNKNITTTELDFDQIKTNIKTFLKIISLKIICKMDGNTLTIKAVRYTLYGHNSSIFGEAISSNI